MAALEKIRKRAVILTIVIGAGLLAFILEEGVRASSSFFNDTTAAKVDNIKIDVQEFNKRYEAVSQQNQNNKQDAAVLQQQMLGQMEAEAILNRECEDNAIEASSEELALLIDNNQQAQAWAQQYVQATGANNVQRPSDLDRLISTDQRLAPIAAQWEEMKDNVRMQICSMKLMAVVSGCIQPNDLDLAEMNEDAAETFNVDLAKKDYTSLDDAKFKPTDADIKAVYDEYKNLFKSNEEQRAISFIAVNLNPSATDIAKGQATVAKAKATLEGANGASEIRNINEFSGYTEGKLTAADAKKFGEQLRDSTVNAFITGSAAGAVKLIADSVNHNYTLLKMVKSELLADTLKVAQVSVQGKKAEQDKVLAALNSGKDVSKMKGVQVAPEQPIAVQKVGMADSMITKLESAADKYIVLQSSPEEGAVFVKCTGKTTAQYYTVGMANYQIAPSSATTNDAQDKLAAFLAKNTTAADFAKNAAKAGYNVQKQMVSSSTAQLGGNPQWGMPGISNSRKAIRWALVDAKAGQVSNIFQDNNEVLIAVAVDEVLDGEFMPLTDESVKKYCTDIAIARKKGESLKKEFEGKCKTVAEYAAKFGTQAANTSVSFASFQAENINSADAGLIGAIAGSKAGQTKFYVGQTAVYAYSVKKVEKSPMKLKKEETAAKWSQMWGFDQQGQRFQGVLMGSAKIKNNLVKFM